MDRLAQICEELARFSSRSRKVAILAAYFRTLDEGGLECAARFLEGRKIAAAPAVLREALMQVVEWDRELVQLCARQVGDTGETIALLLASGKPGSEPMSLAEAMRRYDALDCSRRTADKVVLLRDAFTRFRPETLKFWIKGASVELKIVEEALAEAMGVTASEIREANNRAGDLAAVALAARRGELHKVDAQLFHPMEFVFAEPLKDLATLDSAEWWAETHPEGFRAQAHFDSSHVEIYSPGKGEITARFPELVDAFQFSGGHAVVDGEIVAWRDGRALGLNALEQRMSRGRVSADLIAEVPVVFVCHDLLYCSGMLLLHQPIEERRRQLEELLRDAAPCLMLAPQTALYESASSEGLVLKRRGSGYEAGSWYKVKRQDPTLDVVITAAEQGTGARATVLAEYTLAVRAGEGFVNIGKADQGLSDEAVRELTRVLRGLTTDRFGRVALVRPEVVLEVAFDGIARSPRRKGGYALRLPRIVRWRRDKQPGEVCTLEQVEALYTKSLAV